MPPILTSLFFLWFFHSLLSTYSCFYDFLLEITITVIVIPHLCTARAPFYSTYLDRILLSQYLTTFVQSGCTCRPPLVRLCWLCHSLLPDKEDYFVCLSAVAPLPATMWVLSLYPSWHAPSGSNSSLLLLGSMSSQQDISPKRA